MPCSICRDKFHNSKSCPDNPKNITKPVDALMYLNMVLGDMTLPEGDLLKISNGLKKIYDDKTDDMWVVTDIKNTALDVRLLVNKHEYHIKNQLMTSYKKGQMNMKCEHVTTGTLQFGLEMPKNIKMYKDAQNCITNILDFHQAEKVTVMLGDSSREFIFKDYVKQCIEDDKMMKKAKEECPCEDEEVDCELYMWIGDYRYRRMSMYIADILT